MKHYIFTLFILVNTFIFAHNHHKNLVVSQVVSEEIHNQNGTLPIKVKLKFGEDSIRLNGNILDAFGFEGNYTLNE